MVADFQKIEQYFTHHLALAEWNSFSIREKKAAAETAEWDIMLFLGIDQLDVQDVFCFCALCEQALHVAMRCRILRKRCHATAGMLKSEQLQGNSSYSYYQADDVEKVILERFLSERAERFLQRCEIQQGGCNRISRG